MMETEVIYEIRTYTFKSGMMGKYLQAFRDIGFELQRQYLGECIGFYVSETGPIEQVVQIFGYADWIDRDRKRAALWADERFAAMSAELHPLIQSKESQLFRAAPGWK